MGDWFVNDAVIADFNRLDKVYSSLLAWGMKTNPGMKHDHVIWEALDVFIGAWKSGDREAAGMQAAVAGLKGLAMDAVKLGWKSPPASEYPQGYDIEWSTLANYLSSRVDTGAKVADQKSGEALKEVGTAAGTAIGNVVEQAIDKGIRAPAEGAAKGFLNSTGGKVVVVVGVATAGAFVADKLGAFDGLKKKRSR
jgi:hypothetical protein